MLFRSGVTATFFCTGKKAEKDKDIIDRLHQLGFGVANHGYEHIKGWGKVKTDYLENAARGASVTGSQLYRPPYGSVTPGQFRSLKKNYRVVFWDIILYDFDPAFSTQRIIRVAQKKIRPGSIIVLHDSNKSSCLSFLPELIKLIGDKGYSFGDLSDDLK